MQSLIRVNGKITACLPTSDRGLQYGDGVWETIAVIPDNNSGFRIQFLKDHVDRLILGCQALCIDLPDLNVLASDIDLLVANSLTTPGQKAVLKIIITRGATGRGYRPAPREENIIQPTQILSLHTWGDHIFHLQEQGINLTMCKTRLANQPLLAGFKHLNRLEQVLSSLELTPDYHEGLMLDYENHVVEGTMSNLFIIDNQENIITPELKSCGIKGIMRNKIITWLTKHHKKKYSVLEQPLFIDDVINAQSIFMSNSIIGIWPVKKFLDKTYVIPRFCAEFNQKYLPGQ